MQSCPVPPSRRNGLARSFAVRAPVRDTGCTTVALIVRHPCWSWGACAGGGHIPIGVWADPHRHPLLHEFDTFPSVCGRGVDRINIPLIPSYSSKLYTFTVVQRG